MKTYIRVAVAALVGAAAASTGLAGISGSGASVNGGGISGSGASLLVVGPVEAVNGGDNSATVLGQRVHTALAGQLTVGNEVAVFGVRQANGSIVASSIQSRGLYVSGASPIYLSGTVQKVEPSLGRVVVNGVTVDLTSIMSYGTISPALGTNVTVSGTQPVSGGQVLVSGISGSGASVNGGGISGSGASVNGGGISGSGASVNGGGISGSGH
jgi:hypothetical protein